MGCAQRFQLMAVFGFRLVRGITGYRDFCCFGTFLRASKRIRCSVRRGKKFRPLPRPTPRTTKLGVLVHVASSRAFDSLKLDRPCYRWGHARHS